MIVEIAIERPRQGFSGEDSPMNEGTPRWLGRDPDASIIVMVSINRGD